MITKKGTNNCFICNHAIKWKIIRPDNMNMPLYTVTSAADGIEAEAIAVAKDEYEIIVTCPNCRTKNKFRE